MENKDLKEFNIDNYSIGQNLFIEASAGTGKTYTIELLTAKLVESGIPLSKILIVTFTEKATGELRDRIRQKMEKCLAEKLKVGEDPSAFRKAMQDIHSAPIFTIHSFCQSTLRSFAYEAKAPLNLDVISDDGIVSLIDKYIRDQWASEKDFTDLLFDPNFDLDEFKEECKNAIQKLALAENIQLRDYTISNFDELYKYYPHFKENWDYLKSNENEKNTNGKSVSDLLNAIQQWNGNGKIFPGAKFKAPQWVNSEDSCVWEDNRINKSISFLFRVKDEKDAVSTLIPNARQKFILNHIKKIRAEWEAYKKESKLQSYNNMIQAVHEAVAQKDSELAKRLRETYRIAIIDEFQDTNQNQWDIFSTVFQKSDGKCSIIVVGDPKQSIYSFQGADLNIYQKAISSFNPECGKELQENNRSSNPLIDACNSIFQKDFFTEQNFSPSRFPPENRTKLPATLNGEITKPLWIADNAENKGVDESSFAKYAVTKILECCSIDKDGNTALQVYNKDKKILENVRFSDFAILARTRSEMKEIEKVMKYAGVPFTRYKDGNLFKGREPLQWISILEAINAPDFAGSRKILFNQALFSDFFRITIDDMAQRDYSNPQQAPMSILLQWRKLARNRMWAELQERIYQDSHIDEFLSKPKSLQSIAKIKQIGTYIFDFLYNNRTSLEEAIKHLKGVSSLTESIDDADGNLVAKDSDFDAVQVMTIHASKGLAFPVTIVTGGLKGHNDKVSGPFIYDDDEKKNLGFDKLAKNASKSEQEVEWQRLIYVAYTRAQSIIILPQFSRKKRSPFNFLDARINELKKSEFARIENYSENDWNLRDIQKQVKAILNEFSKKETEGTEARNQQQDVVESLQKSLGSLSIFQYSYSSLANKKKAREAKVQKSAAEAEEMEQEISENDGSRSDKDESYEKSETKMISIEIDNPENVIAPCNNYKKDVAVQKLANYPRGAKLGNALHESFEHVDFVRLGNLPLEEAIHDSESRAIIEERFAGQSFPIARHQDWVDLSASHIWNTLNAELPEIHGSTATGKKFKLKDLPEEDRKHEMEFRLNAQFSDWLNRFCKGFIDLLFVRHDEESGRDYYSILDWKSNVLEDEGYAKKEAVAEVVTEEYSIQRVLYSYCLIQWLKQFYGEGTEANLTEAEIFENYFGGVYYAFVRGCEAGVCNGMYAQTWKNYEALAESYKHVIGLTGR